MSTCLNIVITPAFILLIVFSFSSANLFIMATLQSFLLNLSFGHNYRKFLLSASLPVYRSYFPVFFHIPKVFFNIKCTFSIRYGRNSGYLSSPTPRFVIIIYFLIFFTDWLNYFSKVDFPTHPHTVN